MEFQQLDASTAKRYQGTGLGLALTKRLVEAQGGRVEVRSVPGTGSIFTALLPRALAPKELPARTPGSDAPRLLVVEDEPSDRAWLESTLRAEGYRVEAVGTGVEAIRICREHAFDAITLDLLLPDVSGWEALAAIRETGRNPSIKVVVVSIVAEKGLVAGITVDDVLVKPVSREALISALRRIGLPPAAETVLVLEDDPVSRDLARASLDSLGLRMLETASGAQALKIAEREQPSAVIVDLLLPTGMSGFEFIARLRRKPWGRGMPVIVWTGKDLSSDERTKLEASAQAVIQKGDAQLNSLIEALREVLALPKREVNPHVP